MQSDCVFCKIIKREIPAKVIAENDLIIVIQDIAPAAPVHYLIIPKKHTADLRSITKDDANEMAGLLLMAQELSHDLGDISFRLLMNNGPEAGQSVNHIHAHFLAGKKMHGF